MASTRTSMATPSPSQSAIVPECIRIQNCSCSQLYLAAETPSKVMRLQGSLPVIVTRASSCKILRSCYRARFFACTYTYTYTYTYVKRCKPSAHARSAHAPEVDTLGSALGVRNLTYKMADLLTMQEVVYLCHRAVSEKFTQLPSLPVEYVIWFYKKTL